MVFAFIDFLPLLANCWTVGIDIKKAYPRMDGEQTKPISNYREMIQEITGFCQRLCVSRFPKDISSKIVVLGGSSSHTPRTTILLSENQSSEKETLRLEFLFIKVGPRRFSPSPSTWPRVHAFKRLGPRPEISSPQKKISKIYVYKFITLQTSAAQGEVFHRKYPR